MSKEKNTSQAINKDFKSNSVLLYLLVAIISFILGASLFFLFEANDIINFIEASDKTNTYEKPTEEGSSDEDESEEDPADQTPSINLDYSRYTNEKYGFSINYPVKKNSQDLDVSYEEVEIPEAERPEEAKDSGKMIFHNGLSYVRFYGFADLTYFKVEVYPVYDPVDAYINSCEYKPGCFAVIVGETYIYVISADGISVYSPTSEYNDKLDELIESFRVL